jgi:hypothetical protein
MKKNSNKKMKNHEKKMEKTSPLKVCQKFNVPSFELWPTHVKKGRNTKLTKETQVTPTREK